MSDADDLVKRPDLTPPRICRKLLCISDDPLLVGPVCSAVGDAGEYVTVVNAPRLWHSNAWETDLIRCSNAIARVRPGMVLLLRVDVNTAARLRDGTKHPNVVVADSLDEAFAAIRPIMRTGLAGTIACRRQEIGRGLVLAKRQSRLLFVDESAPALLENDGIRAPHLVAVDDAETVTPVIAANYAFSLGADLQILPQREDRLRENTYAQLDARSVDRDNPRGIRAEAKLHTLATELAPSLAFGFREFVTFVTKGLPYGYFYHDAPSTHLFSSVGLGDLILAGIDAAIDTSGMVCALLIDPGHFGPSETQDVADSLGRGGTVIRYLGKEDASVNNARLFICAFPYDFLFVCSHCGEIGGERVEFRVPDRNGVVHIVALDRVINIASDVQIVNGVEMVLINEMFSPISIDGIDWFAAPSELEDAQQDVFAWLERKRDDPDAPLSRVPVRRVAHSTALQMYNGFLLLNTIQSIGTRVSPIVFMNSCVSFFDAARTLTFAGARGYIGTLAPVDDADAREIATSVIGGEECRGSIALALYKAQFNYWNNPEDRIYVHVGCHFNRLARPTGIDSLREVAERVQSSREMWLRCADRSPGTGRDRAMEMADFLATISTT